MTSIRKFLFTFRVCILTTTRAKNINIIFFLGPVVRIMLKAMEACSGLYKESG